MAPPKPDDHRQKNAIIKEISDSLQRRLELENSPLVRDEATAEQLARQVGYIIGDVVWAEPPPGAGSLMAPAGESRLYSVEVGNDRARANVHPVESLRAAAVLFEVALPILTTRLSDMTPARTMALSLALHEAIMGRVVLASLSYVDFLLDKLQASRREERRRIARELHDRVSHGMGLALQNLELYKHYSSRDPARGQDKLGAAIGALGDSLRTVQQLSAELRRSVGTDGVHRALQAYVRANVPPSVDAMVEVIGDEKTLPPNVSEELYLILREAVRNALRHAAPTRIGVRLEVTETEVNASVDDDGHGFDPVAIAGAPGGGLPSMAERAQLLQGKLTLDSSPGHGTKVIVRVPMPGHGL